MTRTERIAKAKAILNEMEIELEIAEERDREQYLEEQQARLDARAEAEEANEEQTTLTSIEKLFKGLAEFSPDYETWCDNIANTCCSENIYSIIENRDMLISRLSSLRDTLEVPYKMWRRIDAFIKRH